MNIPTPNNKEELKAKEKARKNKEAIYGLTSELQEAGYKYCDTGVCVPYPDKDNPKYYLRISREETGKPELIFRWIEKDGSSFKELSWYKSKKLISEPDKTLCKHLIEAANIAGITLDEDSFEDYITDFKVAINRSDHLEAVKNSEFKFQDTTDDIDEFIEDEAPKIKPYDDYPTIIRDEARKIIWRGTVFEELIKSISLTHEGNLGLKKQLILIIASLFIDDCVHTEINADTGAGKTDIISETLKNFPQGYVHVLRNVSPKNIYYDRESYNDYNIIVFDDVVLSENIIEVIKELADNNKKVKELKTVYDGKSMTFTLPGKYLVILTYAKANPDEELLNRLYKLNIVITEDKDKSAIKKTIQNNAIINAENNKVIERSREIMQAAIQYIIEQKIIVFNPFVLLFDPTSFSNRNIKSFVSLVKSRSFFHTQKLKYIELLDQKIYIGSFKDFEEVSQLWSSEKDVQTYKLNDKQLKILEYLPEMTKDEAYKLNQELLDEFDEAESAQVKEEIFDKLYSRKNIAQAIGSNKTTVRNYLDYSQGTAKSLFDYGLIGRIRFDPDIEKSPYWYYKIKTDDAADEKTLWYLGQIENNIAFDTLNDKIRVLLSLLLLLNISINKEGYEFLKKYCTDYSTPILIDDYNSYYSFIAGAFEKFNVNKYAVKLDHATLEDLDFISMVWAELDETFENKKNSRDSNLESFNQGPENDGDNVIGETKQILNVIPDLTKMSKGLSYEEFFETEVKNPEYAFKLCYAIYKEKKTTKIFETLYGTSDYINNEDESLFMEMLEFIEYLVSKNIVLENRGFHGLEFILNNNLRQKIRKFKTEIERSEAIVKENNCDEVYANDIFITDNGFKPFEF